MTKQELVFEVAHESGTTPEVAERVVTQTLNVIKEGLVNGHSIFIRGFGTWSPKQRAQKTARNIKTGAKVIVPAHKVPHFKPAKEFKEAVK